MIKILSIVGTRPNFVKIAPLLKEIKKHRNLESVLVHTGQHYDFGMSESFFEELSIPKPNYNLGVGSGSHAWQTAEIMKKLEQVVLAENPDLIIVVGDVNSTLAGALTAAKLYIPIAHVEAGLRSFNRSMPEETNRILTDHISDFLFCPTKISVENLKKEGITKGVYNVGDIMYDALLSNIKIAEKKSKILEKLEIKKGEYLLLTVHRSSNTDNLNNLQKIIEAVAESNERIIFPVHPRTKKQIEKLQLKHWENIKYIEPVGYLDMIVLEKNAKKILTDSGGVQKESYWLGVPCITLREETELVETVNFGWNVLVGTDKNKILKEIKKVNFTKKHYDYFGNGKTADKILRILVSKIK